MGSEDNYFHDKMTQSIKVDRIVFNQGMVGRSSPGERHCC